MTKEEKKQIEKLRKEIKKHNDLYYSKGAPEISDFKYDALMKELKRLEEKHPEYKAEGSPTQTVGAPVRSGFEKAEHFSPMLSLESVNTESEYRKFDETCKKELGVDSLEFVCEPKLDGLSVELVYENGIFTRGVTRGDGLVGEDVTDNLQVVDNVLKKLKGKKVPGHISVRGEMLIHLEDFKKLNKIRSENGKDVFANPRNAAAGAVRNLDPNVTAERNLDVYCYRILDSSDSIPDTHSEMIRFLAGLGLKVVPGADKFEDIDEVIKYHHDLESKRDSLDYEVDGVVVKVNSLEYQVRLGERTNNPRWAVAYKFEPRKEITKVEDIVVQVGRTGVLTPVALLKPVEVGGVTVSRATLHNMDEIERLDVRAGDYVKVQRAGDVIPKVIEVIREKRNEKLRKFVMPGNCPSCGTKVEKEEVHCRCSAGLGCPAQVKEAMAHYASKDAVNIDGVSVRTVEQLYDEGLISTISDIYRLDKKALMRLEGWKEKKADNVIKSIESSKTVSIDRFMFGLGIRNVGKHIASLLAVKFGSIDNIKGATREELLEINEVGPEIAESVISFFRNRNNLAEIEKLFKYGVSLSSKVQGGILAGKKIVFTGSLSTLSRSAAKKIVEDEGGEAASSVSKDTDLVVAGEKAGSKLDKARKEGIKIISEEEFLQLTRSK